MDNNYTLTMTVREVAAELGVHEDTVRRYIASGQLPYTKHFSGRYMITAADLRLFREKREQERGK